MITKQYNILIIKYKLKYNKSKHIHTFKINFQNKKTYIILIFYTIIKLNNNYRLYRL